MDLSAGATAAAEEEEEEDPTEPDSWEMEDLDETMSRLRFLTKEDKARSRDFEQRIAGGAGFNDCDAPGLVDPFLREALEKPRERLSILRMEQDIEKFLRNPNQQELEFQGLPTSYLRLAAHRLAQHYSLQSSAFLDSTMSDGSGSRIVLRKTVKSRFPSVRLAEVPVNLPKEERSNFVKIAIKQRPQHRSNNISTANVHSSKASSQKSVEERKEEYNRARAKIFSNNDGSATGSKLVSKIKGETNFSDYAQHRSLARNSLEEKSVSDGLELNFMRSSADDSSSSSSTDRGWEERDLIVSRLKSRNRVAIFRDREVDCKDPDYDRNYDRYMQRFDPGFGFNTGPYAIQPLYSPALNYNTEFPQFGTSRRSSISVDHQPHLYPQHLRGPWSTVGSSLSTPIGYGCTDGMVAPFNPNHTAGRATLIRMESLLSNRMGMFSHFLRLIRIIRSHVSDWPGPDEGFGHACDPASYKSRCCWTFSHFLFCCFSGTGWKIAGMKEAGVVLILPWHLSLSLSRTPDFLWMFFFHRSKD